MVNICIIGSGSFGTALAKTFSHKHKVLIYSIEPDVIKDVNDNRENHKYLPGVILNKNVSITDDISKAKESKIIFFSAPSQVVPAICKAIKPYYNGQHIISTSKGLSMNGQVSTDVIEKSLGCHKDKVLALSGPSFANEVGAGKPTMVMLGGTRPVANSLKRILETDRFFIKVTTDKKGIQLLGFYKNVLAILMGLCEGLELGNNFKSALISKAYSEFYYLNTHKGEVRKHSFIDFAGLGDLYATATYHTSRNRRCGFLIAQGKSEVEIKKEIGQVIEGYENLLMLNKLKDKSHIDENLVNLLLNIVKDNKDHEKMKELLIKYLRASEIKSIIFDWGNVLTVGNYSMRVAERLSRKYRIKSQELNKILVGEERKALAGVETFAHYFARIKKHYPMLKYPDFLDAFKASITYDEAIISYCRELRKRFGLYLLSNNYSIISPILKKSVLKRLFNGMVFSNDVHLVKPGFGIFELLLERYHLRPENCLFVDDLGANIRAAEGLKINAIKYENIAQLRKELEKKVI